MNKYKIEDALRNYHWLIDEISRLRSYLESAGETIGRSLGEHAGMPMQKGKVSNPVYIEVSRREKHWKRIERLEATVKYVQDRIEYITDDRERAVLDCMLDGMKYVAIAEHMRISEKQVRRIKDVLVDTFYSIKDVNAEKAE